MLLESKNQLKIFGIRPRQVWRSGWCFPSVAKLWSIRTNGEWRIEPMRVSHTQGLCVVYTSFLPCERAMFALSEGAPTVAVSLWGAFFVLWQGSGSPDKEPAGMSRCLVDEEVSSHHRTPFSKISSGDIILYVSHLIYSESLFNDVDLYSFYFTWLVEEICRCF